MILILKILGTLLLAALCGWMFRIGGSAKTHARWARMLGVEVTEFLGLILWFVVGVKTSHSALITCLWILLTTGLAWTESTYFKKKGTDAKWHNWLLCGVQYSLIPLPLAFLGYIPWEGFVDRAIILIPIITIWRTLMGNVQWSEGGAGAWQIITLPLLALHKLLWIYLFHS